MQKIDQFLCYLNINLLIKLAVLSIILLALIAPLRATELFCAQAQTESARLALTIDQQIEAELIGGESRTIEITLAKSQFISILIEPIETDFDVTIIDPTGAEFLMIDNSDEKSSEKRFTFIARTAGNYQLKLQPKKSDVNGRFKARILQLKVAEKPDFEEAGKRYTEQAQKAPGKKKFETALKYYQIALDYFIQSGNGIAVADTHHVMGGIYYTQHKWASARAELMQALTSYRELKDKVSELTALTSLIAVWKILETPEMALKIVQDELIKSGISIDSVNLDIDPLVLAVLFNNIALVYDELGNKPKAIELLENKVIGVFREKQDFKALFKALANLGHCYYESGEPDKAKVQYQKALEYKDKAADPPVESQIYLGLALVSIQYDDYQKADDFFKQAMTAAEKYVSAKIGVLIQLGQFSLRVGKNLEARALYEEAIKLLGEPTDKTDRVKIKEFARILQNIGTTYQREKNFEMALDFYDKARKRRTAIGDNEGEAASFQTMGEVYRAKGKEFYSNALDKLGEALRVRLENVKDDFNGIARSYLNIGAIDAELATTDEEFNIAFQKLDRALELMKKMHNRRGEAETLFTRATVLRLRNRLDDALPEIEKAVDIIESVRAGIINQELLLSYFANRQDYYQFYIDLLMQLSEVKGDTTYSDKALLISEKTRARALVDLLSQANLDINSRVDPALRSEKQQLEGKIRAKEELVQAYNYFTKTRDLKPDNGDNEFEKQVKELNKLNSEYEQIQAKIRTIYSRESELMRPQLLKDVADIEQLLDSDSVMLEYQLNEAQSYLWVITNSQSFAYKLSAGHNEIELLAEKVLKILREHPASLDIFHQQAAQLSRLLLPKEALPHLKDKRLLIVSDGALQMLPFGILPSPLDETGKIPLLIAHEIVSLPSAAALKVMRQQLKARPANQKKLVVFADPVFSQNDERVEREQGKTKSGKLVNTEAEKRVDIMLPELPRLPGSRLEAENIVKIVTSSFSKKFLDFDANRTNASSESLNDYAIVHFATHGIIDYYNPASSGLVLSRFDRQGNPQPDGYLRLRDIFNLQLSADLVVLSACSSGAGKNIRGEGVISLTRGFFYAGAQRVVIALWTVDDYKTTALMTGFYQEMFNNKLTPAAALRAVQIKMNKVNPSDICNWGAFTIQGEWQR